MNQDPRSWKKRSDAWPSEHLVTGTNTGGWKGLHDLRTEVLLDLLHSTGQPTLASTFAAAVMALAPGGTWQQALRRAAVRIAKTSARGPAELEPPDRLAAIQYALRALAQQVVIAAAVARLHARNVPPGRRR